MEAFMVICLNPPKLIFSRLIENEIYANKKG